MNLNDNTDKLDESGEESTDSLLQYEVKGEVFVTKARSYE